MSNENLPTIAPPRLPYHPAIEERFAVDRASWKALVEAIFPNAQSTESVILALSYCRARKLDPFKRNVHIVPIWSSDAGRMVDTIWPGIGELRTTAFRTGQYAGRDEAIFGPDVTQVFKGMTGRRGQEQETIKEVTYPEWCRLQVYRMVGTNRVGFAGPKVYWTETYATMGRTDVPNDMWADRPRGQIEKCAEAAALRAAFPEEIGNEYTNDEVEHRATKRVESQVQETPKAIEDKAQALADRFTSKTSDENGGQRQSAETTPASIQANGATGSPLPVAAEPGPVAPASKPAIPAQQATAPTGAEPATGDEKGEINDAEALSQDWPLAVSFMCAQYGGQIADEEVKKGIDRYVVNCGKKGKESKIVTATRIALLSAIRDGSFDFVTGRIENEKAVR